MSLSYTRYNNKTNLYNLIVCKCTNCSIFYKQTGCIYCTAIIFTQQHFGIVKLYCHDIHTVHTVFTLYVRNIRVVIFNSVHLFRIFGHFILWKFSLWNLRFLLKWCAFSIVFLKGKINRTYSDCLNVRRFKDYEFHFTTTFPTFSNWFWMILMIKHDWCSFEIK